MDIHELRSFVVLAEQLHFGRAARVLHLSQPALTKQIRKMEEELGAVLFERGRHGTRLTIFGETWLTQARRVIASFEQLLESGRKMAAGRAGRLRIGFGFTTLDVVPRVVVRLRESLPNVEVMLRDMSSAEQAEALREGEIDIAFMRMPLPPGGGFHAMPVIKDRLALVTPRLEHGRKLRLADCGKAPFVVISKSRSPGFYNHMLSLCATQGFHPRIVQEVLETTTALAMVRAGMGYSILPESLSAHSAAGVQLHRIPDMKSIWTVSAVWQKRDGNPMIPVFLKMLKKVIQDGRMPEDAKT
ncbi:LysR family transcriptional regulator [Roseimicrobium gellanilyticum]|uniref:LysR family transcriptional regulator n=1 Tax=Roseimicrobium gellanilyticum TaxID=748857 RepID=A0A366HN01_9BACT|nr:LysR family transcriptional regulator [Roseimicrobium gellanilyticum]RBP44538.1 LysR family transcriptional regulator [Roseimicrobium gellanilyticum]